MGLALRWRTLRKQLVRDRASKFCWSSRRSGWHVSQALQVPDGIHLVFLPPYSPELQPAERLWPLTNEALANRRFETLNELQEIQAQRCLALQDDPTQIRAATCYHWWPDLAS